MASAQTMTDDDQEGTAMEWVETTGKSIEEAQERALDQLGVGHDDAEFEVLEEPRAGLFGLIRGEARVRARVRPTEVRPKQDRRRSRRDRSGSPTAAEETAAPATDQVSAEPATPTAVATVPAATTAPTEPASTGNGDDAEAVDPALVGDAAVQFVSGLIDAFGLEATTQVRTDGADIDVTVDGEGLGLLIGPGGRTLLAVQDLTRVAAQRRLGDHETRLRVDIAGYRERRRVALERFAVQVAEQVRSSGVARALEPMPSADRKILHDTLAGIDGVSSRSEGDDPQRRVIVVPAD